MKSANTWIDFMKLANSIVERGQKTDFDIPEIQLFLEPSFENHTLLELQITKETVNWYRTTWLKLVDAPAFNCPIQNLAFVGKPMEPSIKYENGTTEIKNINHIIDFIKTISIKPQIEKWGGIILDGTYYTLTIHSDSATTKYKWHYLPQEWNDLQQLADMLVELNNQL